MKIDIPDSVVNNTLLDLIGAVVQSEMKQIVDDDTYYPLREDRWYYRRLRRAAKVILSLIHI